MKEPQDEKMKRFLWLLKNNRRAIGKHPEMREAARGFLLREMKACRYNQQKTAKKLGIRQSFLVNLIEFSGLDGFIQEMVRNALKKYDYNKFLAAKKLGMDLASFSATTRNMPLLERTEINLRVRFVIEAELERNGFFVKRAARDLGVEEPTLRHELRQMYGISAEKGKRQITIEALRRSQGSMKGAAKELGLSENTVGKRVKTGGLREEVRTIKERALHKKAEDTFSLAAKEGSLVAAAEKLGVKPMTFYKRASRYRKRFPEIAKK